MTVINYHNLKQLATDKGIPIAEVCALSPNNDPFYTGTPGDLAAAGWFVDLWQRFGFTQGVHLRRIHYRIVSHATINRPNGELYQNTDKDWAYLNRASASARHLKLIDPSAFIDQRNPDPHLFARWPQPGDWDYTDLYPNFELDTPDPWQPDLILPQLHPLSDLPDLPGLSVWGYGVPQAYHLELWCEKTAMNDILIPLCQQYQLNLVVGAGELSITAVTDFLQRVKRANRPARILYISDYDPAGLNMPVAIARKIEYYSQNQGLDIRLRHLVLTVAQVEAYQLPRIPLKQSDKRRKTWQATQGSGGVELDALEALHPGQFAKIVEEAILDYYDPSLTQRAEAQLDDLIADLNDQYQTIVSPFSPEIDTLQDEWHTIRLQYEGITQRFQKYVEKLQPAIDRLNDRLQRLNQTYARLQDEIEATLTDNLEIDLNQFPIPDPDLPPEPNGDLYNSQRDYFTQLAYYKQHKSGA